MPKSRSKRFKFLSIGRRGLLLIVLLLIIVMGSAIAYTKLKKEAKPSTTTSDVGSNPEKVDLSPPTPEQKKATDDFKQSLGNQNPTPPETTPSGKLKVTPVITSVDNGVVRAYVSGANEDGGSCTATATKAGSSSVTASSTGFSGSSYTTCPPIQLSLCGSGWSVVVSYSSSTSEGQSAAWGVN